MNLHRHVTRPLPTNCIGFALRGQPCNAPHGCIYPTEAPNLHHDCWRGTWVVYCDCEECNPNSSDPNSQSNYYFRPYNYSQICSDCSRGQHSHPYR